MTSSREEAQKPGIVDFCAENIDIADGIMYNIEIVKISLYLINV